MFNKKQSRKPGRKSAKFEFSIHRKGKKPRGVKLVGPKAVLAIGALSLGAASAARAVTKRP